mmetsp:Transcript_11082/g.28376  ORF Transcript_11082/g.28376 Transcript_11082/m.28376 type:complete len:127 (-) Transcript_11082:47-427(-)
MMSSRSQFKPQYEVWLAAPRNFKLPEDVESRPDPDGVRKQVRIPDKWELVVDDGASGTTWSYYPVERKTLVLELRRNLAGHLERTIERVALEIDGRRLDDAMTAEMIDLFNRRRDLKVVHTNPWWM